MRGMAGCYENGETASSHLVELSYDFPVVIDIILPATETDAVVATIDTMVADGIVAVVPAAVRFYRTSTELFPRNLHVRDIMTHNPTVAHPDLSARAIAELLLDGGLKAFPVAGDDGSCIGMVTQSDLSKKAGMPMQLAIDEALMLMTEGGFKRLPVVDADGMFKGMIRRDSILLALAHSC